MDRCLEQYVRTQGKNQRSNREKTVAFFSLAKSHVRFSATQTDTLPTAGSYPRKYRKIKHWLNARRQVSNPLPFLQPTQYIQTNNNMTSLPWTPLYAQAPFVITDSTSLLGIYAMALTITFTVFVFSWEHLLDERQKIAYQSKEFPKDVAQTVQKIDDQAAAQTTKEKDAPEEKQETDTSELDSAKPLLPQLQAKFEKSQLYGADKLAFSMVSSTFGLVEAVVSLLCGLLPYTWDVACQWGETYFGWTEAENEIKISLIFLFISTVIGTITSLPFELVRLLLDCA